MMFAHLMSYGLQVRIIDEQIDASSRSICIKLWRAFNATMAYGFMLHGRLLTG